MNQIIIEAKNAPSVRIDEVVVSHIRLVGEDGLERIYSLASLKHQITVAEFWEAKQPSLPRYGSTMIRDQIINDACEVLRKNGIYQVDLTQNSPVYEDLTSKIELQKKVIDALKFTIEILCKTISKPNENGLVYMVSMVNVDLHDVRYICSTESRAIELFEELRQESVNDIEEIISYHKSNLKQSSSSMVDYNVNEYHQHGLEYETMRKKFLTEMKSGMVPPFAVDRPLIEVFPLMTEMKKKDDTVNSVNNVKES